MSSHYMYFIRGEFQCPPSSNNTYLIDFRLLSFERPIWTNFGHKLLIKSRKKVLNRFEVMYFRINFAQRAFYAFWGYPEKVGRLPAIKYYDKGIRLDSRIVFMELQVHKYPNV